MTDLDLFRDATSRWVVGREAAAGDLVRRLAPGIDRVILVEGVSDAAAVETLAASSGVDFAAREVCVIPMGGVTNVARFLATLGPGGLRMRLAGLYDAGEERHVRRGLERAGLEPTGFFACTTDLEDELIRALGTARVEQVLAAEGDLHAFRTFQNQPGKRGTPVDAQLHRFLGTTSGRKERYGRILVEALDLSRVPQPLASLLSFVA